MQSIDPAHIQEVKSMKNLMILLAILCVIGCAFTCAAAYAGPAGASHTIQATGNPVLAVFAVGGVLGAGSMMRKR